MQQCHYMKHPKTGEVKRVALPDWPNYRASGWTFASFEEFKAANRPAGAGEQPSPLADKLVSSFNQTQLQLLCDHFSIEYKAADRKPALAQALVDDGQTEETVKDAAQALSD